MDPAQVKLLIDAITGAIHGIKSTTNSVTEVIPLESFSEETETWEIFTKRLENFFNMKKLTGTGDDIDDKKKEWLIHSMGTKTLQLLYNLTSPNDPTSKSYDTLVKLVKDHLHPAPSIIAEQNRFTKRVQQEGENIANFVAELKKLSKNCNFFCASCKVSTADAHLRQQFISGLRNTNWLEKLIQLKEPNNTFEDCVRATLAMESAHKDSKEIQHLQATATSSHQNQLRPAYKKHVHQKNTKPTQKNQSPFPKQAVCYRCGDEAHLANACKHVHTKCSQCFRVGHLKRVCMSGSSRNFKNFRSMIKPKHQNQLQFVEASSEDEENEIFGINTLHHIDLPETTKKPPKITLDLQVDNIPLQFEFDTGAAVSTISYEKFKILFPNKEIKNTSLPLRTYTGEIIHPIGFSTMEIKYNTQVCTANIYILPGKVDTIFGREWLQSIKVNLSDVYQIQDTGPVIQASTKQEVLSNLQQIYSTAFKAEIGKINNYEAKLFLKDNVQPIYYPARKIPYALLEKINNEIDRLEKMGLITKIEYSEFGTPIVPVVKKDGSIRLCADYKVTINKLLKDDRYPIPNLEDIFATTMLGGKIFTTLDIREAYLHMPVDIRSSEIQAITTPKGDYRVNRLMFGTKVAPAIWQRYITRTLADIPGVCVFLDDIKIQGANFKEHLERLHMVLQRLQEVGLRIKQEKCKFFETSITYLGYTISYRGLQKTPDKIKAVTSAPAPTNVTQLKSWLGMVNYYGRFFKGLATKLHSLYRLLQKDVPFRWTKECETAFNLIKSEITSDNVLCAYDPNLPLSLATDASPYGLGAVLSHTMPNGYERPIAYASRSLTRSEEKYSQIDKEATAIFWGVNRFFQYCYGRKFKLITDHKPLVAIFNPEKHLPNLVATRMLHYALFLQGFDYEIVYRSTTNHANADALSRLPIAVINKDKMDTITTYQLQQISILPVTFIQIAKETSKDPTLKIIYENLRLGNKIRIPGYQGKDTEFSLTHGIILKGLRVVIPTSLREKVLKELHLAHIGIVKMKALARSYVWWPLIDTDIELLAQKCKPCQDVQKQSGKEPVHCWEFPSTPWKRVHIDFAGPFFGKYFLLVIDAFSKWPEIIPMTCMTATKTISILRNIFARFGLPIILVSDNGPTFTSHEFQTFVKMNGIQHKFSAPYKPSTNGQVERLVQSMKNALRKMTNDPGDVEFKLSNFLLQYRKTPNATTGISPSMLMFNRDIRTVLDLVKPNFVEEMRTKQESSYSKTLTKEFRIGETVRVRTYGDKNKKWEYGKIIRRDGLLHYFINIHGQQWRRHVDQISSTKVQSTETVSNECCSPELNFEPESNPEPTTPLNNANLPEGEEITHAVDTDNLRRSIRIRKPVDRLNL